MTVGLAEWIIDDTCLVLIMFKHFYYNIILSLGTIAETYLLQHRGISPETIPRLEFRYLPDKKQYRDSIRGELMADAALVVAALNMAGELTGIQRVFLDPNGDKSKRSSYSKKVKGVVKGSLCYVQRGKPNGLVYVVEGPETGAAIATVAGA